MSVYEHGDLKRGQVSTCQNQILSQHNILDALPPGYLTAKDRASVTLSQGRALWSIGTIGECETSVRLNIFLFLMAVAIICNQHCCQDLVVSALHDFSWSTWDHYRVETN